MDSKRLTKEKISCFAGARIDIDFVLGPFAPDHIQEPWRKDLLYIWRGELSHITNSVGSLSGVEPTHAGRDGSSVCF